MRAIAVGDLYESGGRRRMVWSVDSIIAIPGQGAMVRLVQVDGIGRVTFAASDLIGRSEFRQIAEP